MLYFRIILLPLFILISVISEGQQISLADTNTRDTKVLLRKEQSGFFMVHTSGFGFGYRNGKHLTGYKKRMFEIELTGIRDPKEIKSTNPYIYNSTGFVYGQENSFFILRGGIGIQKIINSKPYWGGVELRYFYYGGFSLGLLKPVYLYVQSDTGYTTNIQKFDMSIPYEDIKGRASFFNGLTEIKPVPGIYFKTGLNFEYGSNDEILKAIEIGAAIDIYLHDIPIMAYNTNKSIFASLFLSFHFGKRGN